jgi:hypothetical protein
MRTTPPAASGCVRCHVGGGGDGGSFCGGRVVSVRAIHLGVEKQQFKSALRHLCHFSSSPFFF